MKSWKGKCAILRHENNKLRKNMEMWRKKFEEGADKDFAATSYAYKAQNCTVCERIQLDGSSKWAIYDQHGNMYRQKQRGLDRNRYPRTGTMRG
jgi:hypothetical protein